MVHRTNRTLSTPPTDQNQCEEVEWHQVWPYELLQLCICLVTSTGWNVTSLHNLQVWTRPGKRQKKRNFLGGRLQLVDLVRAWSLRFGWNVSWEITIHKPGEQMPVFQPIQGQHGSDHRFPPEVWLANVVVHSHWWFLDSGSYPSVNLIWINLERDMLKSKDVGMFGVIHSTEFATRKPRLPQNSKTCTAYDM